MFIKKRNPRALCRSEQGPEKLEEDIPCAANFFFPTEEKAIVETCEGAKRKKNDLQEKKDSGEEKYGDKMQFTLQFILQGPSPLLTGTLYNISNHSDELTVDLILSLIDAAAERAAKRHRLMAITPPTIYNTWRNVDSLSLFVIFSDRIFTQLISHRDAI